MRRIKRVLMVVEYFAPHVGGVETLFFNVATALGGRGIASTVVTLLVAGAPERETLDGSEVVRIRTPRRLARYFFMLLAIPAVLRHAGRADIIHTTTYNAALPALLGGLLRRKPVIITVHEVFADQWNHLLGMPALLGYGFRLYEWLLLHLPFRHFICDSEFTRRRLLALRSSLDPDRTSVAYPPLDYAFWDPEGHRARDLRRELGLSRDTFVYLYFGRPGLSKGVEYLVEAAVWVAQQLPASRLVMILARDPAEHYARIQRKIDELGLRPHVVVLDPVERRELPSYLLATDCVVVPSVSEGFGYAAVEAATIGCHVITTAGHSVEEVLRGAADFVPSRDSRALADAIVRQATRPHTLPRPPRYEQAEHVAGVIAAYGRVIGQAGASRSAVSGTAE